MCTIATAKVLHDYNPYNVYFTVCLLREAMEQLNVLKLSDQDRKRYEYDLYDSHYEEDIVDTARFEGREEGLAQGRMEGLEQGRQLEKEAMAKKMREAGVDLDIITMIIGPSPIN